MVQIITAITFDFWNTLFKLPTDTMGSRQRINRFYKALRDGGFTGQISDVVDAVKDCWEYANLCQRTCGREIAPAGHVKFILEKLNFAASGTKWDEVYFIYTTAIREFPPQINDDVKETLPLLAEKYKLAVICNTGATPGAVLREFLASNNIKQYFQLLVFSDEVGWAKPNAEIFRHTLEGIQVESCKAAHIGDDAVTDIAGAKKAGMKAVWLAPRAAQAIPECDYHVRSVKELIGLF